MTLSRRNITFFPRAVLAAALVALAFTVTTAEAQAGCKNAHLAPVDAKQAAKASRAAACLVNAQRRKHGLKKMRWNKKLRRASTWMANDMISYGYFDHQRAGGPDFAKRILRFGYASSRQGYSLGENIAYASAPVATAGQMVKMWMNSPGHRANILRKQFREQGMAAVYTPGAVGAYAGAGPVVVFVNQFGARY